ncbi:TRAP transporter small permease [Marivivens aquimaris]|uniref:TRAP transporter small permease n=1 Tax=Marivivens aquimaris TaxID=2774876 RepID=UPI001881F329|nr:TRAP transporter small permease [Marivivens aquimaris]
MKNLVIRITHWCTLIARAATGAAFLVIIGAVVLQLLGRSGMMKTVIWTEELTRFALLWLTAFGAGLGLRSGDLVNVDILSESLPGRFPWAFRLFGAAATAVFAFILIEPAQFFTKIGARQTAPALGIHMNWVHAASLVMLLVVGIFAALRVISMLLGAEDGLPVTRTEED